MRICVSPQFKKNLKKLKNNKVEDIVYAKIEDISINPDKGRPLKYALKGMRGIVIMRQYIMIYKCTDDTLWLLNIDRLDRAYD